VSTTLPRLGVLSCLTGCDQETGLYIAHCLDFDLVESGPSRDEAWMNLKSTVKHHIEYCVYANPKGLGLSAEPHYWQEFASLMRSSTPESRVIESIDISLQPPLPATEVPVWMHGVTTWQNLNFERAHCEH
jgi:hypothetical protein